MKKNSTTGKSFYCGGRFSALPFSLFLFPFSLIFGVIATLRRKAFQKGWLHPETFNIPTICVGNLRVGGTGKTPFVEYLANFLSQNHKIAILSRGYGRKTTGYINVHETQNFSSEIIGDEPLMYAQKFPNIEVAVCENRKTGLQKLLHKNPDLDVVILDDAYQHLAVNYSLKIILTEYKRPYFKDFPLPFGNLREFRNASKYADIIIVTKCPNNLSIEEQERFIEKLKPNQGQEVFFTKIGYQSQISNLKSKILLITGIDNPEPLVHYLKTQCNEVHSLHFPDHHKFTKKDIQKIIRIREQLGGDNCTVITTEKDATRLQSFENMPSYFTIPIETVFIDNETAIKEKFSSLLNQNNA